MKIRLFVDDVRRVPDDTWELRKTVVESAQILASGIVEELSLDHDICHLSGGVVGAFCSCPEDYSTLAILVALMPKELRPKKVWLHSANPGGRYKMMQILKDADVGVEERPIDHPDGIYVGPMKDPRDLEGEKE